MINHLYHEEREDFRARLDLLLDDPEASWTPNDRQVWVVERSCSTQTFPRLRQEVGPTIGMNLDPSHLRWQGIDPMVFVETIGEAIYTCQVKEVALDRRLAARDGLASSACYDD